MRITQEDVKHIANLSRLLLTEEEAALFGAQLNTVIDYIEQLKAIDTSNVYPTSHVVPLKNVMRDDVERPSLPIDDSMRNAPDPADKYYRVPKIID